MPCASDFSDRSLAGPVVLQGLRSSLDADEGPRASYARLDDRFLLRPLHRP